MRGEEVAEELCFPDGPAWRVAIRAEAQTALVAEDDTLYINLSADDREWLALPDAEGVYFETPGGLRYFRRKGLPLRPSPRRRGIGAGDRDVRRPAGI